MTPRAARRVDQAPVDAPARGGRAGGLVRPALSVAGALGVAGLMLASCASSSSGSYRTTSDTSYGALPGWLPKAPVPTNRVLVASTARPQLGIEGDEVHVALGGAIATLDMTGPTVPPFVAPPPPVTRATFSLTVRASVGRLTVRARDFALVDGNGDTFFPTTFVGGRSSYDAVAGRPVLVRISEDVAVGSGSLRWAPDGHDVMTWEFTVEND